MIQTFCPTVGRAGRTGVVFGVTVRAGIETVTVPPWGSPPEAVLAVVVNEDAT